MKPQPCESPAVMTVPLMILAAGAVLLGVVGTPAWPWFDAYLSGHPAKLDWSHLTHGGVLVTMLLSTGVVVLGVGVGWWLYGRLVGTAEEADALEALQPAVFRVLRERFYVDELYGRTVVRLNQWLAWVCDGLDRWLWGKVIQGTAQVASLLAVASNFLDERLVNGGFDLGCESVRSGARRAALLQSGRVQTWLRAIGLALAALVLLLCWGCNAA